MWLKLLRMPFSSSYRFLKAMNLAFAGIISGYWLKSTILRLTAEPELSMVATLTKLSGLVKSVMKPTWMLWKS